MPLVNTEQLEKIYDAYLKSSHDQPATKKGFFRAATWMRSLLPANKNNEFIQRDPETVKEERIKEFLKQYKDIANRSVEKQAAYWVEHLKILQENLDKTCDADTSQIVGGFITVRSKFNFMLRVVANLIYRQICDQPIYIEKVNEFRNAYQERDDRIQAAKAKGREPQKDDNNFRDSYLKTLVSFCDPEGIVIASQLGLLSAYEAPNKSSFRSYETDNPHVDQQVEIHCDVPWPFQDNFPEIYEYRKTLKAFPPSQKEWQEWKRMNEKSLSTFCYNHLAKLAGTGSTNSILKKFSNQSPRFIAQQRAAIVQQIKDGNSSSIAMNTVACSPQFSPSNSFASNAAPILQPLPELASGSASPSQNDPAEIARGIERVQLTNSTDDYASPEDHVEKVGASLRR